MRSRCSHNQKQKFIFIVDSFSEIRDQNEIWDGLFFKIKSEN
jgi:hypothetical protein